jgi:hypothetical protein
VTTLNVVRDLLDKQMLDRNGCEMGRVDGLVFELPENGQPRLVRIEAGGTVLAARVGKWLVRPLRKLEHVWGPHRIIPVKISWKRVEKLGRDVHLGLDAEETTALAWEKWLDKMLIDRLPGAKE